jgi:hypothetical protein
MVQADFVNNDGNSDEVDENSLNNNQTVGDDE